MPAPDRYAVIGHPIAHSRSPQIHTLFAQQTAQNIVYSAIDIEPSQLLARLPEFFDAGGRGLNVTVPHKQTVQVLLDSLSERARTAGAVNTIVRDTGGGLFGDNTDGVGLVRDLTANLHIHAGGQRILLLGAGGAARGVLAPLLQLRPSELVIANRTVDHAVALAAAYDQLGTVRGTGFAQLEGHFDLIINATAASLHGQLPPLPTAIVSAITVCYDLVYGSQDTLFVRWARDHGAAQTHMGLGMLVEQAAESFYLWRGVRPDTASVLKALQQPSSR